VTVVSGCSDDEKLYAPVTHEELYGIFSGPGRDGRTIRIILKRDMTYAFCLEQDCITGKFEFSGKDGIGLHNVLPGEIDTEFAKSISPHPDGPLTEPAKKVFFDAGRCEDGRPCFDFRRRDGLGGLLLNKVEDY